MVNSLIRVFFVLYNFPRKNLISIFHRLIEIKDELSTAGEGEAGLLSDTVSRVG